jgi:hypothetical protein
MLVAGTSPLLTSLSIAFVALWTRATASAFDGIRALHTTEMREEKKNLRFGGEDKETSIKQ